MGLELGISGQGGTPALNSKYEFQNLALHMTMDTDKQSQRPLLISFVFIALQHMWRLKFCNPNQYLNKRYRVHHMFSSVHWHLVSKSITPCHYNQIAYSIFGHLLIDKFHCLIISSIYISIFPPQTCKPCSSNQCIKNYRIQTSQAGSKRIFSVWLRLNVFWLYNTSFHFYILFLFSM